MRHCHEVRMASFTPVMWRRLLCSYLLPQEEVLTLGSCSRRHADIRLQKNVWRAHRWGNTSESHGKDPLRSNFFRFWSCTMCRPVAGTEIHRKSTSGIRRQGVNLKSVTPKGGTEIASKHLLRGNLSLLAICVFICLGDLSKWKNASKGSHRLAGYR